MIFDKAKITNALVVLSAAVVHICFFVSNASAQLPMPQNDIYLVPMTQTDSGLSLGDARLVTKLKVYDDQPSFSVKSDYMYYASEAEDFKTDVYAVYIPQFQNLEYIGTGSVNEYYPQQKPDMSGLGMLREDPTNKNRQVWFYGTDAMDKCLTPLLTNVTSYQWFGDSMLTVLLAGKTNTLCLYNLKKHKQDTLVTNAGSSYGKVPSENAVYYTQTDQGLERLYRYNIDTHKSDTLLHLPGGCTEFTVAIDGSLWCANKGVVYRWPRAAAKWDVVKDFGGGALGEAFRVAVSRDMRWLAVVTMANY